MISFIWKPKLRLPAGTGGTENYTTGQVRELLRRGIAAQIVTIGLDKNDGRDEFVDIPFISLTSEAEIANLDGTVVFVNGASHILTKQPAFIIMHVPPPKREIGWWAIKKLIENRTLITTSKYAAKIWADHLGLKLAEVRIVYPFAEPCFGSQVRKLNRSQTHRILFAGRLSAEKGFYTFFETLDLDEIEENPNLKFTVTTAGADDPLGLGRLTGCLVQAHPDIQVLPARKTPAAMAKLMATQDIIIMPSNSQYWHETFGIISIEAQHSGCWVVASDDGGLPETDCGGLILVKPDDALALAEGIYQAIANGPLPTRVRRSAAQLFTVEHSVDNLLTILP